MRYVSSVLALSAALGLAGAAAAEPYVDYTPQKGATEVVTLRVDPNHIDDYLTGLGKSWVPEQERAKAHGVIDGYSVSVKLNSNAGPNVNLITHYPSLASLDPDKAREQAMMAESRKAMSDEEGRRMTDAYDKYRTFVSDNIYVAVDFPK